MNKVAKEKSIKYVMDKEALVEKGHLILTDKHTVIHNKKDWTLYYRPELKENNKGIVSLFSDSKSYYPSLEMVIRGMLNDIVYHNAKSFSSDLSNLQEIMGASLLDISNVIDGLGGSEEEIIALPF